MKCPKCSHQHKVKAGMTCGRCGYRFVLNPKKSPYLTDGAFNALVDRLSHKGQYYFTYGQLYAALASFVCKKKKKKAISGFVIGGGVVAAALFMVEWWFGFILLLVGAVMIFFNRERLFGHLSRASHEDVSKAIRDYSALYPLSGMVSGKAFKPMRDAPVDAELFKYAPERILIVERNDMVDVLVLNRFHFDNKTLVVGASKYPEFVFRAYVRFLETYPDIPVYLVHDASLKGIALKNKLTTDPEWRLQGKEVRDLGLRLQDLDRIKQPLWLPSGNPDAKLASIRKPQENIRRGMRSPVDFAAPAALGGLLAGALVGGLALLSEELLASQLGDKQSGTAEFDYGDFG